MISGRYVFRWIARLLLWTMAFVVVAFIVVWTWSLTLQPSHDRQWFGDQAVLPTATFTGDVITVHNMRNFSYRAANDYTPAYYDKTFDLNELERLDFIVEPFWAIKGLAHTFVTFGFRDGSQLAISVETRREEGEDYNLVAGLLNQYELMYVIGDERDLIGVRAAIREDDIYLYPVKTTPEKMRQLLVELLTAANSVAAQPRFYHTFTANCTTVLMSHINTISPRRIPWSYKVIFPGFADQLGYELGLFDIPTSTSLTAIKNDYRINDRVPSDLQDPDFSAKIRNRH